MWPAGPTAPLVTTTQQLAPRDAQACQRHLLGLLTVASTIRALLTRKPDAAHAAITQPTATPTTRAARAHSELGGNQQVEAE
jgi:hypothetical protein